MEKPEYPEKNPLGAGTRFSNVPETFRAREAISKTMKPFM